METRDSVKGEKVLSGWCIGEEKTALSLNNLSISVKKGKFNNSLNSLPKSLRTLMPRTIFDSRLFKYLVDN